MATTPQRRFTQDLSVINLAEGVLVRQGDQAYVARNWQLTPATAELIETALEAGLGCMIRSDHPRQNARWPNPRGVVYLAFSARPDLQWSLAIDTYRPARGDYGFGVFNGKYLGQFTAAGIPFTFEGRNKGAGHLVVQRDHVLPTLRRIAAFDHQALELNQRQYGGRGFPTEYVLQRHLLENWNLTPWAGRYCIVQDEFPVDGGLTSRRIDILAQNIRSGDWLVIELKRAEASVAAVEQVAGYVRALSQQDRFGSGRLEGVLVAERMPADVHTAARHHRVALFEIEWPCHLRAVP